MLNFLNRHLMDLSPVGSRFNNMVVSGELRNYFTQEELKEMNQYIKESSSLTYSDIYDDATTICSSYPNSRGQEIITLSLSTPDFFDFLFGLGHTCITSLIFCSCVHFSYCIDVNFLYSTNVVCKK